MAWHKESGQLIYLDAADGWYDDGWHAAGELTETLPDVMLTEDNIDDIMNNKPLKPQSDSMLEFYQRMIDDYFNEDSEMPAEIKERRIAEFEEKMKPSHGHYARYSNYEHSDTWVTYGLDSGGFLTKLPDNIDPTWLEAAKEMVGYLHEFYASGIDPYLHHGRGNLSSESAIAAAAAKGLTIVATIEARIAEIEKSRA